MVADSRVQQLRPIDGLSHVRGETDKPLIEKTIGAVLADTVAACGDRDALIDAPSGTRLSWTRFMSEVDTLASGLAAMGLTKGMRVGIWSPNRVEWVLTQFATARLGLVLVNINPAYRLSELEYALNKVGCTALITAASFKSSDYLGMLRELAPEIDASEPNALRAARLPMLRLVVRMGETRSPGMMNFDELLSLGRERPADLAAIGATLDANDAINIQFTSGTTGSPKGATLTHRNILNNADQVAARIRLTRDDRLCIPVPLYHCFGMVMGTLACMTRGAAMIFPSEGFEPLATLQTVAAERCTALYGVPTMFVAMLDAPEFARFDLSSLRTGIMAGAPCPIEVMKRVNTQMPMGEVTIAYGMTETSPVSFQSHTDDPTEKRVATVGRIHPHVEVKIVNEQGETLPVGQPGELLTRGYSVMLKYWDDDERTAESIDAGGWMHTGDQATIDEDGYCAIVGRIKDMVIRGGENIYPREVEEFLYRHPAVQAVQCFGVPDAKYGEELAAWIILKPGASATEDEIRQFCRGQIAHYKIPRYVRFKDELPMTVTGKPQKFLMRDAMTEELRRG
ncbi:MAG: AMP-binding protein [Burkholderiaceae bacterium]